MKNTKTKIILILGLIVVMAMIAILTIMFILPIKGTKSNQEELWNYVFGDNIQLMVQDYFSGEDYEKLLSNKKYTSTTNISFKPNIARKEEINKHLKNLELNISEKVNNETNQAMGSILVNYLRNQVFKLDYIKDNQSIGLKSDELVDRYLGIKNENLDTLTQKLGWNFDLKPILFNEKRSVLPNIDTIEKIKQASKEVFINQINSDKIEKQTKRKIEMLNKQVTVDSYTITLNDEETYKIISALLKKISENDEIITELSNNNILFALLGKNISKDSIQSYINQIESKEFSNEPMIMATIYVMDQKMVKFDFDIISKDNNKQYTLETQEDSGKMKLTINKQEKEKNLMTEVEIGKEGSGEDTVHYINITNSEENEEKNKIIIKTKTEGSLANNDVTNRIIVDYSYSDSNIKAEIENKIKTVDEVEIENLSSNNCAFANNMDESKLNYLYRVIYIGIQNLYQEKKNMISSGQLQTQTNPLDEEVKEHNAEFAMYDGEFAGKIVVELLNKVVKSNAESNYKIALKTKLDEKHKTDLSNTDVTVENVQSIANLLKTDGTYIITIHYHQVSGAIDEITIVKSGLEETDETPKVMIPLDNENQQNNNQQQDTDQQQDTNQQQDTDQQQDTNQQQDTDQQQDTNQQ